jgi:hypothetical protein
MNAPKSQWSVITVRKSSKDHGLLITIAEGHTLKKLKI